MRMPEKTRIQLIYIFTCIWVVFVSSQTVYSAEQQLYFTRLSTKNGLSHNRVHVILQDSKGFLWFGTSDGLNRYDGINFKTFYKKDLNINSSFIVTLCEDNQGNIWIGTDNGVAVYDSQNDLFRHFDKVSSSGQSIHNKVPIIGKDDKGVIWMAVNNQGLFSYDPKSQKLNNYFVKDGVQQLPANITSFYFDNNNFCWLGLYFDNLYSTDKSFKTLTPYSLSDGSQPYKRDYITRIIKSPYNSIYIASVNKGICEINLSLNSIKTIVSNAARKFITNDLVLEGNSELWMGTTDGLFKYDLLTNQTTHIGASFGDLFSLSDSEILSIAFDDLKGIWIGTYSSGLNHANYAYMDFEKFYKTPSCSLIGTLVRGFVEDKEGNIWIGTEKAGLFRYSPKNNFLHKYENSHLPDNIFGICYENDNLWMGSYSGVYRLNLKTNQVKSYNRDNAESKLKDNKIYKIYKNSLNQILIGTTLGLLRYDESLDELVPIEAFNGVFVCDILEDTKGNMWYATYADGLYKYDIEKNKLINFRNNPKNASSIPYNKILSVFEDSKNRIWVTTHGAGFCKLNNDNTFTTYDVSDGMPNDIIYKIVEDENENLWISSNKGLIKFSPEKEETKIYTDVDGLLNNEFNYNSGIKTNEGEILFGSKDGFIKFNPQRFVVNKKIPSIVITDLLINNVLIKADQPNSPLKCSISQTRKIELSANQNSLEFRFSVLNFHSPSNNKLYYKLEGYNDDWQKPSEDNSIIFNKLPAGKYKLCLKGVSSDGIWNETYPPIEIIVSPRFYLTKLAIFFYIVLALALLFFILYYLRKRAVTQQIKQQKIFERNREIELYNEKINFFSNIAHEIKTPLTLIRTPLENIMNTGKFETEIKEDLNLINQNTQQLSRLINELLDFSRIEKNGFQLVCSELDVVEKIEFLKYNFNDLAKQKNLKLTFTHSSDKIFVFADEQGFIKIINNLFSNALKYAEEYIEVNAEVAGYKVVISFKNDGQIIPEDKRETIFSPFTQYRDPGNVYMTGFGIGLSLARTLAELHSGSLVINDDFTCNNFILTLPLLSTDSLSETIEEDEKNTEKENQTKGARPVILLVEDNLELLKYIKRKIENDYAVLSATNGKLALDIINKDHVDVIVSDISMPEMSGLEMCEQLKANFETSHIPIIILSAHSSTQSKITSMEYGADIYIEKPFSLEFLVSCIEGLLIKRKNLRDAYNSEIQPTPKHASLSKRDEQFLLSMDEIILSNMSDPEFSIEQLAEHLCLSKSTLNRKVKGLLQITPNDYIRTKRLIMAARLLKEGSNRINETCYLVGFNTPSYFIKCFKSYYGKLPSEYLEDKISH